MHEQEGARLERARELGHTPQPQQIGRENRRYAHGEPDDLALRTQGIGEHECYVDGEKTDPRAVGVDAKRASRERDVVAGHRGRHPRGGRAAAGNPRSDVHERHEIAAVGKNPGSHLEDDQDDDEGDRDANESAVGSEGRRVRQVAARAGYSPVPSMA